MCTGRQQRARGGVKGIRETRGAAGYLKRHRNTVFIADKEQNETQEEHGERDKALG